MLLDANRSQLVLVDYQARLMPAMQDAQTVLANATRLAELAALLDVPLMMTEQVPQKLGGSVPDIPAGGACLLGKTHFSAVPDGLGKLLQPGFEHGRDQIVIAGCETHVCLLQTAIQLLPLARALYVVADACSSRHTADREIALSRMATGGATIVTTEMVGFEWLRDADHPQFRKFQAMIR